MVHCPNFDADLVTRSLVTHRQVQLSWYGVI